MGLCLISWEQISVNTAERGQRGRMKEDSKECSIKRVTAMARECPDPMGILRE